MRDEQEGRQKARNERRKRKEMINKTKKNKMKAEDDKGTETGRQKSKNR